MQATEHTQRSWVRRHPWLGGLIAVALVVAAGFAVLAGAYLFRSRPGPKSITSAVEQYRKSGSPGRSASKGFAIPAPGVYRATGEGDASISMPPNSQRDGAVMPVTVTILPDDCWRWRIDYNTARWHEIDYCVDGKQLLLVGQRNHQVWDYGTASITNTATYECDPPGPIVVEDPKAGQVFEHRCSGDNTAAPGRSVSVGPAKTLGRETLHIGGAGIEAIHQRRTQRISGVQTGTIEEDWWFDAVTGMPLRGERVYELKTDSPVGRITYEEHGTWQLATLTPRT